MVDHRREREMVDGVGVGLLLNSNRRCYGRLSYHNINTVCRALSCVERALSKQNKKKEESVRFCLYFVFNRVTKIHVKPCNRILFFIGTAQQVSRASSMHLP